MNTKIFLDKEFERIWQKIDNNENFTLLRYSDGERAIMQGREVIAQEGWKSPKYISTLGKDFGKLIEEFTKTKQLIIIDLW